MTERTVKLSDREVRAVAFSAVADLIDNGDADLFNRYPLVSRQSLSKVQDVIFDIYLLAEAGTFIAAGGEDGWNRLIRWMLTGEETE